MVNIYKKQFDNRYFSFNSREKGIHMRKDFILIYEYKKYNNLYFQNSYKL